MTQNGSSGLMRVSSKSQVRIPAEIFFQQSAKVSGQKCLRIPEFHRHALLKIRKSGSREMAPLRAGSKGQTAFNALKMLIPQKRRNSSSSLRCCCRRRSACFRAIGISRKRQIRTSSLGFFEEFPSYIESPRIAFLCQGYSSISFID